MQRIHLEQLNKPIQEKPQKRDAFSKLAVFFWIFFVLYLPQNTFASAQPCSLLFKQNKYLLSAQCYDRYAKDIEQNAQASKIDRYRQGEYLRKSSLALIGASKRKSKPFEKSYLQEKALAPLQKYLQLKLCQGRDSLCRLVHGDLATIRSQIGYARLNIVTDPKQLATVQVVGYRYKKFERSPPAWSQSLRPGEYQIDVSYDNQKLPIQKVIILKPKQSLTLTLFPSPQAQPKVRIKPRSRPKKRVEKREVIVSVRQPKPPRKSSEVRVLPWALVGLGVLATGLGVTMFVLAKQSISKRDILSNALKKQTKNTKEPERADLASTDATKQSIKEIEKLHSGARSSEGIGWVATGLGVAVLVTGTVLLFTKNSSETQATLPAKVKVMSVQNILELW